jgi:hypothetical protein
MSSPLNDEKNPALHPGHSAVFQEKIRAYQRVKARGKPCRLFCGEINAIWSGIFHADGADFLYQVVH